jgi:hypothetical protein
MLKIVRLMAAAGVVSVIVALTAVALTDTAPLSADRGTRADSSDYTQLAYASQRSGR